MKVLIVQFFLLAAYQQFVEGGGDSFASSSPSFNSDLCTVTYEWSGKFVCAVLEDKSYADAEKACWDHGMNLFVINNEEVEDVSIKFANNAGLVADKASVWINGMRTGEGWVTRYPVTPLLPSMTANGELQEPGNCLQVVKTSRFESFFFSAENCDTEQWFICERPL